MEVVSYKSLKPSVHPCNVYDCVCAHKAIVPQGLEDGLAGDHEEQVNMMSERRQGKADMKSQKKKNPEKSLNPVEFLSSSTVPLGGVRSLWRERDVEGIDCYCLEDELVVEGVKSKGHHRTVRGIYLLTCFKQHPPLISVRGHCRSTFNS
ncbi:hypothetical protein PAMP_003560 [Pampus punctatissimus]